MPEIILVGLLSQRSKTAKAALFLTNMNKFKEKKKLALKTAAFQCATGVAYFSFSMILTAYHNVL